MSDPRRKSPLAHREALAAPGDVVLLHERAFDGKLILRISLQEAGQALDLPVTPNRSLQWNNTSVMWLGPDEWMFVTLPGEERKVRAKICEALGKRHYQLTDVSDYYTTIEISGVRAPDVLMKLTMFDLHPRAFRQGDVAGTMFAKTAAWIVNTSADAPEFDLVVRWSMADYLWCLLAEAGREFGMVKQSPIGQVKGLRYKAG